MKGIVLEKEDLSYHVKVDLIKMQFKNKDLINLYCKLNFEKISVEKKVALESNSIEVERLRKELSILQEYYDLLKKEKELISTSTSTEKASLISSNFVLQQRLDELVAKNSALEDSISRLKVQVSTL